MLETTGVSVTGNSLSMPSAVAGSERVPAMKGGVGFDSGFLLKRFNSVIRPVAAQAVIQIACFQKARLAETAGAVRARIGLFDSVAAEWGSANTAASARPSELSADCARVANRMNLPLTVADEAFGLPQPPHSRADQLQGSEI